MAIDFRKILAAYIRHVGEQEGVDFLGTSHGIPPGLTKEEIRALYVVALEGEPAGHYAEYLRSVIEDHS